MQRRAVWTVVVLAVVAAIAFPPQWYPRPVQIQLTRGLGPADYQPPPASRQAPALRAEAKCPPERSDWRRARSIEGVNVRASPGCVVDNPFTVAAAVRGTNNVSRATLMASGLSPDAVVKRNDLDGDGDPDDIHIRLEVAELNGGSPELVAPATQYPIAPGVMPGLWVFAPKHFGMATENFASRKARRLLRAPSPAIRVEQGDRVRVTLENSHYMPHTIHLHGSDHSFVDANGEGNDGVPLTSEPPVLPGGARTYELQPRAAGTTFYHCHVQPHVHVMMGLQGLFVIEENRAGNWLQTLNIGAGHVRAPSAAVSEAFDHEYDLHYSDIDKQLNDRIRRFNDVRLITRSLHRDYDITDSTSDYFLLNGRSFPYTFREALVVIEQGERVKLRVVNGGSRGIALHTHGHKVAVTHKDGAVVAPEQQVPRDVVWIATAQRVDLALSGVDDGRQAYGPGVWLFHDHQNHGVTTDGIGPGGNISAIVYEQYHGEDGWPRLQGVSLDPYFSADYYRKQRPIWAHYAPGLSSSVSGDTTLLLRAVVFLIAAVAALLMLGGLILRRRSR